MSRRGAAWRVGTMRTVGGEEAWDGMRWLRGPVVEILDDDDDNDGDDDNADDEDDGGHGNTAPQPPTPYLRSLIPSCSTPTTSPRVDVLGV